MLPKKKKMFYMLENDLLTLNDPKHDLNRYTSYLVHLKKSEIADIKAFAEKGNISEAYLKFRDIKSKKGKGGKKVKYLGIHSVLEESRLYIEKKFKKSSLKREAREFSNSQLETSDEQSLNDSKEGMGRIVGRIENKETGGLTEEQEPQPLIGVNNLEFNSQSEHGVPTCIINAPATLNFSNFFDLNKNNAEQDKEKLLKELSNKYNDDYANVCILFEKVSENLEEIEIFYERKNNIVVWDKIEDDILLNENISSTNYKLLERYKGSERIEARKKYLATKKSQNN